LKVKRVCSKCGREMGKGQADVKCPYCGGNVINVTVIKGKGEK
jgi:DNA-directed RNA polymerase subunit RPC12/RpoP